MGRGGGLVMAAWLTDADASGYKHLFQPYRPHISVAQPCIASLVRRVGPACVCCLIIECSALSEATAEKIYSVVSGHVQSRLMPDIMGDADSFLAIAVWCQWVDALNHCPVPLSSHSGAQGGGLVWDPDRSSQSELQHRCSITPLCI